MAYEYITEAIILDTEPNGDLDLKVSILTYDFGKIIAKVKSARKLTSKLRGHIEPGYLVCSRIVFKNYFQLVDALKIKKLNLDFFNLFLLNKLLPEFELEKEIYLALKKNIFNWKDILKILGWDLKEARCAICSSKDINAFEINSQNFLCKTCSFLKAKNDLIYL